MSKKPTFIEELEAKAKTTLTPAEVRLVRWMDAEYVKHGQIRLNKFVARLRKHVEAERSRR